MSTDLYGIRVLEKDESENRIKLRVFVVYYDPTYKTHEKIPDDISVFMRVIWGYHHSNNTGNPILSEVSLDEYLDEDWINKKAYIYIDSFKRESVSNYPVTDFSIYDDFYYERDGAWIDEDKLVQGDYNVYLTDIKYLENINVGDSWGTTAYETKALTFSKKHKEVLPDFFNPDLVIEPFWGEKEKGTPLNAVFSRDGKYFYAVSQAGEIVAFQMPDFKELWRDSLDDLFAEPSLIEEKNIVFLKPSYSKPKCWDMLTGKVSGTEPEVDAKLFSPKNNYAVNFMEDNFLHFLEYKGKDAFKIEQPEEVDAVAFSFDDKLVAMGGFYNSISIWDLEARKEVIKIETENTTSKLAFDAKAEYLSICSGHDLSVIHLKTGRKVFNYSTGDYPGPAFWSPDNKYFIISTVLGPYGYGGDIKIYKLSNQAL